MRNGAMLNFQERFSLEPVSVSFIVEQNIGYFHVCLEK